jgi:hypothetical protein
MPPRPRADRRMALVALAVLFSASMLAGAEEPEFGPARLLRPAPEQPANALLMSPGLTPFEPVGVSSRVRRTLLQYEALAADGAWDEAIELIERLQTEAGAELTTAADASVPLKDATGHERYLTIAQRCQQLLSALPPEGLAAYRARVDRSARQRLDDATARLDAKELEQLVSEFQASEPAAYALLALGELALERGDYAASRRWHSRLHPMLWDPFGRPAAMSLALIDPTADPVQLADAWTKAKRPAGLPLAPKEDDLLPLALSRLALTSIREGDLRRAAAETRLLRALAPEAEGRIAGRVQPLVPALEAMLEAERSAETASQGVGELTWAWAGPVEIEQDEALPPVARQGNVIQLNPFGQLIAAPEVAGERDADAPPTLDAVVHGSTAYFVEAGKLQQMDLATGEKQRRGVPGISNPLRRGPQPSPGDVANAEAIMRRLAAANGARNFIAVPNGMNSRPAAAGISQADPELSIAGDRLYLRVVESQWPARMRQPGLPSREELVAIRLDADAEKLDDEPVRFAPPSDTVVAEGQGPVPQAVGYQFVSTPTVVGDRLYIAVARPGTRTEIAAACYAAGSGRLLWKTDLGSGDAAQGMFGVTAAPPVAAGDTLYLATNLGAVAALDATTGRLRWLARYPREGQSMMRYGVAPSPQQQATKCVVIGDQVIAAPSDSSRLLAWDTATGAPLWDADRPRDAALVGVVQSDTGSAVVLAGRQLASYDTLTGQRRMLWPESPRSGVRGLGEAAIVGDEVFWPTREAIFAINPLTGGLTRSPIDLSPLGNAGANLVATHYGLLVCGPDRLRLLARTEAMAPPEPPEPVSRLREADSVELAQH